MKIKQCSNNSNTIGLTSKTLANGLKALAVIAACPEGIGVRELARRMDLNPTLAQRLINTLAQQRFIEQDENTRRYAVGIAAFEIGRSYIGKGGLVEIAQPLLKNLSLTHQINTYLGVRDGHRCVYLIAQQSPAPISVRATPGDRIPLHTTAMGKVLLAALPDDEIRDILVASGTEQITPRTKVGTEELLAEIRLARQTGIAVSDEENLRGVFAVGTVIWGPDQEVVAGISCACPSQLSEKPERENMERLIVECADKISRRMGAAPRTDLCITPKNMEPA